MSEDIVDLDALVPPMVRVKFGDGVIEVPSPKTGEILVMASLFRNARADDLTLEETNVRVDALTQHLYKMVPALEGKPLNIAQLIKLVDILDNMALPPERRYPEQKRIT